MESTDHLKKGDKVKIQSKRGALQHGHQNYVGCVVTIDGIKTVGERVYIKEFVNDPDALDWIPIEFVEKKVSYSLPENLFEI